MAQAAAEFLHSLPDPDNVGQSEYLAIHELLSDVSESWEDWEIEPDKLDHIKAVLDELEEWAKTVKGYLKAYREGEPG